MLLNFVVARYNVLDGAVAELVVEDFGQNCIYFGNLKEKTSFGMQILVY